MPVTIEDGRVFIKHDTGTWDWIMLDAFRGGFVPPHLKTQEFYQECAARLDEQGVLVSNLHDGTKLFAADLKTLKSVFPQVILFNTGGRGNVIACAVKYSAPDITDPANWTKVDDLKPRFKGWLPIDLIRDERMPWPTAQVAEAKVLTDDFNPTEMLNAIAANNETQDPGATRAATLPGFVWPTAGGLALLVVAVLLWRGVRAKKR
jgi:spermidine synthase